jgi:hypothetical protein
MGIFIRGDVVMRQNNMFCFYVVSGVVRHADCRRQTEGKKSQQRFTDSINTIHMHESKAINNKDIHCKK